MCPDPCLAGTSFDASLPVSSGPIGSHPVPSIREVLAAFLEDQKADPLCSDVALAARVVAFLELCVDNHGHRNLNLEERVHYEAEYASGRLFADVFGPSYLLYELDFFCARFLKEDVITAEATERAAPQVVTDLKRFLVRAGFVSRQDVLHAEKHWRRRNALMPRTRRAARLASQASRSRSTSGSGEEVVPCDDHLVAHVEPGLLHVVVFPNDGAGTRCAVEVPDEVSSIVKPGWCVCAGLSRCGDRWRFVDVQDVYPGPRPAG